MCEKKGKLKFKKKKSSWDYNSTDNPRSGEEGWEKKGALKREGSRYCCYFFNTLWLSLGYVLRVWLENGNKNENVSWKSGHGMMNELKKRERERKKERELKKGRENEL